MRALRIGGGILLAVLVTVVAALALVLRDPRVVIARALPAIERATGRAVTIGSASADVFAGGLTLRDVVLTGADPDVAPQRIAAGRVEATLSLAALLSGRVDVRRVALADAQALFETDPHGALHVGLGTPKPPPTGEVASAGRSRPATRIEAVEADRVTLVLRNRAAGTQDRAELAHLSLSLPEGGPVSLAAQGTARAVPFGLTATGGPEGAGGAALKLALVSGADRLTFEGDAGPGLKGAIAVDIPDPAVVTPLLGEIALPPVTMSGRIDGTAEHATFDLAGDAYGSHVVAKGEVTTAPRPRIRADVVADRLDPGAWHAAAVRGGTAAPAVAAAGPPSQAAVRPPPNLRKLNGFEADITLKAGVIEPGVRDVSTHLVLQDGLLVADPLAATYDGVSASGRATLDARGETPAGTLSLPGVKVPASALGRYVPLLRDATGVADVHAELRGSGLDLRAIEASLTGPVGVAMEGGAISPAALAPVLAAAKLPELPAKLNELRCLGVRAAFQDGVGVLDPIALDSAGLRLVGTGSVDLRDQTVALRLHPLLRAGGFGVTVPVVVSGPIAAPRVAADIAAGKSGGLVIGALSLALQATGGEGPDPCPAALRAARFEAAGASTAEPAAKPKVNPAELLRGLFR